VQTTLLLLVAGTLLFGKSMLARFDHDEHQFVASGVLLSRFGQLPYRDYPYFHTPYLAFFDALLFKFTSHLLLAARIASCAFGTGIVGITAAAGYRACRCADRTRWMIAIITGLLLMTNPIFIHTSGLAWNHDASEFLTIASVWLLLLGIGSELKAGGMFAAGMLLGGSIGVRLTAAPLVLPFLVMVYVESNSSVRWRNVASLLAAISVALLPLFWIAMLAPAKFVFGNFRYPQLSTMFWELHSSTRYDGAWGKLHHFLDGILIVPGTLMLTAIVIISWLAARAYSRGSLQNHPYWRQIRFLLILFLFTLIGAFAPTPQFPPYFFPLVPLAVMLAVYLIGPFAQNLVERRSLLRTGMALIAAAAIGTRIAPYCHFVSLADTQKWTPMQIHRQGVELRLLVGTGPVLTLEPIIPLEGGIGIYAPLATGPFAARTVPFVACAELAALNMPDKRLLQSLFLKNPPVAVLLGEEGSVERELLLPPGRRYCPGNIIVRDSVPDDRLYAFTGSDRNEVAIEH
jgi:hypothetical protein